MIVVNCGDFCIYFLTFFSKLRFVCPVLAQKNRCTKCVNIFSFCCSLILFLKFILVLFPSLCGLSARNCKKFRDLSEGRNLLASGTFSGIHSVDITL